MSGPPRQPTAPPSPDDTLHPLRAQDTHHTHAPHEQRSIETIAPLVPADSSSPAPPTTSAAVSDPLDTMNPQNHHTSNPSPSPVQQPLTQPLCSDSMITDPSTLADLAPKDTDVHSAKNGEDSSLTESKKRKLDDIVEQPESLSSPQKMQCVMDSNREENEVHAEKGEVTCPFNQPASLMILDCVEQQKEAMQAAKDIDESRMEEIDAAPLLKQVEKDNPMEPSMNADKDVKLQEVLMPDCDQNVESPAVLQVDEHDTNLKTVSNNMAGDIGMQDILSPEGKLEEIISVGESLAVAVLNEAQPTTDSIIPESVERCDKADAETVDTDMAQADVAQSETADPILETLETLNAIHSESHTPSNANEESTSRDEANSKVEPISECNVEANAKATKDSSVDLEKESVETRTSQDAGEEALSFAIAADDFVEERKPLLVETLSSADNQIIQNTSVGTLPLLSSDVKESTDEACLLEVDSPQDVVSQTNAEKRIENAHTCSDTTLLAEPTAVNDIADMQKSLRVSECTSSKEVFSQSHSQFAEIPITAESADGHALHKEVSLQTFHLPFTEVNNEIFEKAETHTLSAVTTTNPEQEVQIVIEANAEDTPPSTANVEERTSMDVEEKQDKVDLDSSAILRDRVESGHINLLPLSTELQAESSIPTNPPGSDSMLDLQIVNESSLSTTEETLPPATELEECAILDFKQQVAENDSAATSQESLVADEATKETTVDLPKYELGAAAKLLDSLGAEMVPLAPTAVEATLEEKLEADTIQEETTRHLEAEVKGEVHGTPESMPTLCMSTEPLKQDGSPISSVTIQVADLKDSVSSSLASSEDVVVMECKSAGAVSFADIDKDTSANFAKEAERADSVSAAVDQPRIEMKLEECMESKVEPSPTCDKTLPLPKNTTRNESHDTSNKDASTEHQKFVVKRKISPAPPRVTIEKPLKSTNKAKDDVKAETAVPKEAFAGHGGTSKRKLEESLAMQTPKMAAKKRTNRSTFKSPLILTPKPPDTKPIVAADSKIAATPSRTPLHKVTASNIPTPSPQTTPKSLTTPMRRKPFKSPSMVTPTTSKPTGKPVAPSTSATNTPQMSWAVAGLIKRHPEVEALINQQRKLEKENEQMEVNLKRIHLAMKYIENNEGEKVDALIAKWKEASRSAIEDLRDAIGEQTIPSNTGATSSYQSNQYFNDSSNDQGGDNDSFSRWCKSLPDGFGESLKFSLSSSGDSWNSKGNSESAYQTSEARMLTLQEVGARLGVDITTLGTYDKENDVFL
ncbi:hypothetical protein HDV05_001271 [Chytridiales sp. JEL 0842]|nr:hypothetical protein HDV05_001271 [Chytridiales sp. JEL 0842]